jgi:6-phosphogluconolactonase
MRCSNQPSRGSLAIALLSATAAMVGCDGGSGSANGDPPMMSTYTVSATVTGLSGQGLVLELNGSQDKTVATDGTVTFPSGLMTGAAYAVTVKTQPTDPTQTCVLTGGTGTVTNANVSNIAVTCTTSQYTVGGSVSGLIGSGLVLQDNGGNDLAVASNGNIVFPSPVNSGSAYAVTIRTQPTNPTQTCVLAGGAGTVSSTNVSNVVATCTISPGRFAYVSGALSGVYCYAIDAITGALTALSGSPCDSRTQVGVTAHPSGRFVYATLAVKNPNAPIGDPNDFTSYVTAYAVNSSTGSLGAIAGSQLSAGLIELNGHEFDANSVDITVDPSGRFVYMADYTGGISAYTINPATGGLNAVSGSPFPVAPPISPSQNAGVNSVAVDPTGKFVYAALNGSNAISAYTINSSTGALTTVVGSPFPADRLPMAVRVDPSGRYAYAVNMYTYDISAYLVNSSSGALTPIAGSPFSSGGDSPTGLGVDLSGRFLYVTNSDSNSISAFSINGSTGALTPISGSPFASGAGPWGTFVHPSGKFLYVTNNGEGTISGYAINNTSGSLTPISGSPFVASGINSVYAIAFSN